MFLQILDLPKVDLASFVLNSASFPRDASIPVTTYFSVFWVNNYPWSMKKTFLKLPTIFSSIFKGQGPFDFYSVLTSAFEDFSTFVLNPAEPKQISLLELALNLIALITKFLQILSFLWLTGGGNNVEVFQSHHLDRFGQIFCRPEFPRGPSSHKQKSTIFVMVAIEIMNEFGLQVLYRDLLVA